MTLLWVDGTDLKGRRTKKVCSDHVALLWVGGTDLHEAGQWRWQHSKKPVKVRSHKYMSICNIYVWGLLKHSKKPVKVR